MWPGFLPAGGFRETLDVKQQEWSDQQQERFQQNEKLPRKKLLCNRYQQGDADADNIKCKVAIDGAITLRMDIYKGRQNEGLYDTYTYDEEQEVHGWIYNDDQDSPTWGKRKDYLFNCPSCGIKKRRLPESSLSPNLR